MSLYFGTTEITKIDNLVPQTGLDITDMWFGSTNVYTVWQIYEGTLPATLNANGADMRQYQIYGNTGGVGDDSGIMYGYEADISISDGTNTTTTPIYIGDAPLGKDEYVDYQMGKVYRRTAQVMPSAPAETKTLNGITITCDGEGRYSISGKPTVQTSIRFDIPEFTIPASLGQGGQGTMSLFNTALPLSAENKIGFYYNSELVDAWSLTTSNRTSDSYVKMGNNKCNAIIINIATLNYVMATLLPMFTDNGTLPETYIPYLQPTDPPVPLPALPTWKGETVVDYAGQSQAVPEKVLLKYRKEGY